MGRGEVNDPLNNEIIELMTQNHNSLMQTIETYKKALIQCQGYCEELLRQNQEYKSMVEQVLAVAEVWKRRAEGATLN
jgi:hypothetical protein